jgi:hypothetical protein
LALRDRENKQPKKDDHLNILLSKFLLISIAFVNRASRYLSSKNYIELSLRIKIHNIVQSAI